jgi:tripartite-type tricarboxylate transporter receptor subunit TctC
MAHSEIGEDKTMKSQRCFKGMNLAVRVTFLMMVLWTANEGWTAEVRYPTRPIQIVIAYAPGTTDTGLRPFIEKLPDYLGQPTSFVYKPGANGAIGASFVAKAKPDGYTLFGTSQAPIITTPLTQEGLDYALDDFSPICRLVESPIVLAAKADSPLKTLKDIIEEAKKFPGKMTFSTSGVFSTIQLPTEIFSRMAGITLTHVPCTGTSPAVTALLGGHVTLTSSSMAPLFPHLKSHALRPIAVYEKERLKEFPDVPTFSELGYPIVYSNWYGILAPKRTPEEIVRKIYASFKKGIEDHRNFIEERVANMSLKLVFLGPEEFTHTLKAENEAVKKIVKELMTSRK